MKLQNGQKVCFGKVVRLTVYAGGQQVVLLYAPNLNEMYNANIEAEVQDIANPMRKNNDLGFTATVTVTNPPQSLVQLIATHIGWVARHDETEEQMVERALRETRATLLEYYQTRPRCRLEVGYWDYSQPPLPAVEVKNSNTDEPVFATPSYSIPGLTKLFEGYLNSSALYHDGQDDILKFACHAFDASLISTRAIMEQFMCHYPELERRTILEDYARADAGKRTAKPNTMWHTMFRNLIREYEYFRPNPNYGQTTTEAIMSGKINTRDEFLIVNNADREKADWIDVRYIYSPNDLRTRNEELRKRLEFDTDVSGFYTNAGTLAEMLTDLSNEKNAMVNWMQYNDFDETHSRVVYFVWPRGEGLKSVRGQDADIKIINYQNLLESPSASVSGALHIKMFLNTACIPLRRIALILDPRMGADMGTGDEFVVKASTIFRESMGVHGQLNPYMGTRQLANAQSVYAQQLAEKDIYKRGYLFNTGFPIIKAKHHIQTHGQAWETEVETIPMWEGLHVEVPGV